MKNRSRSLVSMYFSLLFLSGIGSGPALAEGATAPAVTDQDFCSDFADKAAEARLADQRRQIEEMKSQLSTELAMVSEKTAQLEALIARRESLLAAATRDVIKIYGSVEPDSAAQQLQSISPGQAAVILRGLNAKRSGEILSAMSADVATPILQELARDLSNKPDGKP